MEKLSVLLLFTILGVLCGIIYRRKLERRKDNTSNIQGDQELLLQELKQLHFEKTLSKNTISTIHENFANGKIDVIERDRLLNKYIEHVSQLDERIKNLEPVVDIDSLIISKERLEKLLDLKIKEIETKIKAVEEKLHNYNEQKRSQNVSKIQIKYPVKEQQYRNSVKDHTEMLNLKKEISDALERLNNIREEND